MNLLICFFLVNSPALDRALQQVQLSSRVLLLSETDSERLRPPISIAPGAPPVLSFRYMEGSRRGRFGDLDLMVDDAGH